MDLTYRIARFRRPRELDSGYLKHIRTLPCCVCGWIHGTVAAHVRYTDLRYDKVAPGIGARPDDRWAVPLCDMHHRQQHARGEQLWWVEQKIDPVRWAVKNYRRFKQKQQDFLKENPEWRVTTGGQLRKIGGAKSKD